MLLSLGLLSLALVVDQPAVPYLIKIPTTCRASCSASTPLQAVAGQDVFAIESPTPRPRRRLKLSTKSSTENSQLPSNLSQHSVHLPDFWATNVVGYFKTIELLFNDNGVTSERSKYASLVTALSKDKNALSKVTDILQRLGDQVPYSQIKTALLDRYSSEQITVVEAKILLSIFHCA